MKETILGEVSTLGETMQDIYEELVTVHKEVVRMLGLQQHCKDIFKTLINVQAAIVAIHEWTMRYKGAPLELGKNMKPHAKMEKARMRMLI